MYSQNSSSTKAGLCTDCYFAQLSFFLFRVTNVFYEQYLTIVPEGLFNISLCLLPTFVVCCLLLGLDLRSGLLNLITIVMIVVDTVGVMTLWGIDYNAVALINLVTVRMSFSER